MSTVLRNKEKQEIKGRIVDNFYTYCNAKFGSFDKFMKNDEFNKMMNHFEPKFGDSVFSTLADIVAEMENIAIKDLLVDFSKFIKYN